MTVSQDTLGQVQTVLDLPTTTPAQKAEILSLLEKSQAPTAAGDLSDDQFDEVGPAGLEELSGGFLNRGVFEAAGGTAGAGLGIPAGPMGVIGGGALGAAGGSALFDNVESGLRAFGFLEGQDPSFGEVAKGAAKAGVTDAAFAGTANVGIQAFRAIKPGIGKILGLRNDASQQIIADANRAGIPVGAVDVAQGFSRTLARGAADVLGVFPFLGAPFKTSAKLKGDAIVNKSAEILDRLAPNASLGGQLGIDVAKAARKSMEAFRAVAARNYDNFREKAQNATVKQIFPSEDIVKTADDLFDISAQGKIILKSGDELPKTASEKVTEYVESLRDLPELLSIQQVERLSDDLKSLLGEMRTQGVDIKDIMTIKESIEQSLSSVRADLLPPGEADALVGSLKTANKFYAENIAKFQTPTAQKIGRVDKNMFKPGPVKPGTLNDDELQNVLSNTKSVQGIKDIRELAGDEPIRRFARKRYQEAMNSAQVFDDAGELKSINWPKVMESLGLSKKTEGFEPEVFKELLKSTGVSSKEFTSFLKTASRVKVTSDVATFVARRAVLGGFAAGAGAATGTALIPGSKLKSLASAVLVRYFSEIMSSPEQLKMMRRSLHPQVPENAMRGMLGRIIEANIQGQDG